MASYPRKLAHITVGKLSRHASNIIRLVIAYYQIMWPRFATATQHNGASINDVHKNFGYFDPLPSLSAFGTDLYCEIHTTSLTPSAFPWPLPSSDADILPGGPLKLRWQQSTAKQGLCSWLKRVGWTLEYIFHLEGARSGHKLLLFSHCIVSFSLPILPSLPLLHHVWSIKRVAAWLPLVVSGDNMDGAQPSINTQDNNDATNSDDKRNFFLLPRSGKFDNERIYYILCWHPEICISPQTLAQDICIADVEPVNVQHMERRKICLENWKCENSDRRMSRFLSGRKWVKGKRK